tara:strand:- start:1352 stop:2098 length:747 start_codon:yes stop_codon:yes gene_type:complete
LIWYILPYIWLIIQNVNSGDKVWKRESYYLIIDINNFNMLLSKYCGLITFFRSIAFCLFFLLVSRGSSAQGFIGTVVIGANVSQIDGDNLLGWDKIGINSGFRLGYNIANKTNLAIEFLYSQRGSAPSIASGSDFGSIDLKYIEIPLLVEYNDWYLEEEDYYKVGIEGGLSYGNLFSVSSSNSFVPLNLEGYKKNDISYTIGARYSFTKHLAGVFRFSQTIGNIYANESGDLEGQVSRWMSFRIHYTF